VNIRSNYVILITALVAAPIGIANAVRPDAGLPSVVTSLAAIVALGTLLPHEWKRDRRAAAALLLVVAMLVLMVSATSWVIAGRAMVALGIAICALLSVSYLALVLWREYSLVDLLPSWLDQQFPGSAMFEDDGVQWTLDRSTAPDEAPLVQVHLQNNIEATRTVELRLLDESGFAMRSGALLLPRTFALELTARAHATIVLPFRWHPQHTAKKVRLYCFVSAKGPAAPRNRRLRAQPGPRPTPKWLVVLGPLGGHIVTRRGGVHLVLERPARPAPPTGPLLGRAILLERPALVPLRATAAR
jgi:hypothetical protein